MGEDLRVGILDTLVVAQDERADPGGGSWILLGSRWGSCTEAWRTGRIDRRGTGRMGTCGIGPRLPSAGIPHFPVFPPPARDSSSVL